jgi:hypothetical protein
LILKVVYPNPCVEVKAHYASLERPHACIDDAVYIGRLVEDPGTGEEVEVFETVPCRKCVAGEEA